MNTDMKKNFWLINHLLMAVLFLCLNFSCNKAQVETDSNVSIVKSPDIQNNRLKDKAAKLNEFYDKKNCKEFVNAFPNNFQEFNELYGYEDGKGGNILYSKTEHINYLFTCSEVVDDEKLNKIIEVGIDGKWDADNIGEFQNSTYALVKKYPEETKKIMDNLSDKKSASFWYFLFDGPHPSDKENVSKFESLSKLLGEKSTQSKLLSEQFQKLLKEEKEDKDSAVIGSK